MDIIIKNKNILLTGGAGFIGSHLLERLINNSNYVVVIDNFSSSESEKNLLEIEKNYEIKKDYYFVRGDLVDYSNFTNINSDI